MSDTADRLEHQAEDRLATAERQTRWMIAVGFVVLLAVGWFAVGDLSRDVGRVEDAAHQIEQAEDRIEDLAARNDCRDAVEIDTILAIVDVVIAFAEEQGQDATVAALGQLRRERDRLAEVEVPCP